MSTPRRRPRQQTRLLGIDNRLYLITSRTARHIEAERLDAKETALALRMLDDIQAEVEAIVLGGRRR